MSQRERQLTMSPALVPQVQRRAKRATRRLYGLEPVNYCPDHWQFMGFSPKDRLGRMVANFQDFTGKYKLALPCPYGAPGDVLWLRENYRRAAGGFMYQASATKEEQSKLRWKPSIHMPREACRLFLEHGSLHVERLHQIDEEGARDEGMVPILGDPHGYTNAFRRTWITLNGEASWTHNPWVWVINFEVITNYAHK